MKKQKTTFGIDLKTCFAIALFFASAVRAQTESSLPFDGVSFQCAPQEIQKIKEDMRAYFRELNINSQWVNTRTSADGTQVTFTLATPESDTNTVNLRERPEYQITDEAVTLPTNKRDQTRSITVVSKKEIALSLLQHGRSTLYSGYHCKAEAFKDNVGIRQNTVAWVEGLGWGFPDGKSAHYNSRYWGPPPAPLSGTLHEAILDAFLNEDLYSVGCHTAAKWVMINGVLDYYARIKKDDSKVKMIEMSLMSDGRPLTNPASELTWTEFYDINPPTMPTYGKVLVTTSVSSKWNFVAGDWVYFRNPDLKSRSVPGYEGSNAIYLGRAGFNSFYFERKRGHFTFTEKVQEVYSWRFKKSERRDISPSMVDQLLNHPNEGGLLYKFRIGPIVF